MPIVPDDKNWTWVLERMPRLRSRGSDLRFDDGARNDRGECAAVAAFTIDSFTRYLVHDPVHHIWDVEQGYQGIGGLWAPPTGRPIS